MIQIEKPSFKKIIMTIGNLPSSYVESLSYYECMLWLCNYLENTVIPAVNNNGEAVEELQTAFTTLQTYIENYFDNLDVQEEINTKLDEMAEDGSLTDLISSYVDPIYQEYEESINTKINQQDLDIQSISDEVDTFKTSVNSSLDEMDTKIDAVASGSPAGVYATVSDLTTADPDHDRTYVVLADGKWYYYNSGTSTWTAGGTYQSTEIADNSVGLKQLKSEVIDTRYTASNINFLDPYACQNNKNISNTGEITDNSSYWISGKIPVVANDIVQIEKANNYYNGMAAPNAFTKICLFDSNDTFVEYGNTANSYQVPSTLVGTGYVIMRITSSMTPFDDRFKLVVRKLNDTDDRDDYFDRKFYPYLNINSNNNNCNVKRDDINIDLAKCIDIRSNFTWEMGSIASSTGRRRSADNRIRTVEEQLLQKGTIIRMIGTTYQFGIILYNDDNSYNSGQAWISNDQYKIYEYVMPRTSYVRFVIRKATDGTITTEEIPTITSKLEILYTNDQILDILNKNSMYYVPSNRYLNCIGKKIDLENKMYWERENFYSLAQGACCYGDKAFIFNASAQFKVYDFATNTTTPDLIDLDQNETITPHCNACFFGTEKYDESDDYPLLYVNAYNATGLPKGTLYAYRVQYDSDNSTYVTTLVQTISIGFTDNEIWTVTGDTRNYGNFVLNYDTNELIAFTLRDNKTRFFTFSMPTLAGGSTVTLATTDIIDMFDTELMNNIQDCCYINNQVLSLRGLTQQDSYLEVVDLGTKHVVSKLYLGDLFAEPEAIFIHDKSIYIGSYQQFFKFN